LAMDEYASIADLYDYVVPYRERQDIDFFVQTAQASGGPVLEVASGTGRVLIPIARAGVQITGFDLSSTMLQVCQRRLLDEPEAVRSRITLKHGDMRDFDLSGTFNLAILPFRPFQHLTNVDDQLSCLSSIHRHLVPGGQLVLDLFNPWLEGLFQDNVGKEIGEEPEFATHSRVGERLLGAYDALRDRRLRRQE